MKPWTAVSPVHWWHPPLPPDHFYSPEGTMDTEDIRLTRDELLSLLVPAAQTGPPGLAEKLLAYHRMGRYENFVLPDFALSTDEREFILKARAQAYEPLPTGDV